MQITRKKKKYYRIMRAVECKLLERKDKIYQRNQKHRAKVNTFGCAYLVAEYIPDSKAAVGATIGCLFTYGGDL